MYNGVLCCALSLYFSLSNTIHTDDKCFFARVIDGYVSRISDILCVRLNHKITEQGSEFTVVPSLRPLHTISRGEERKYGVEILPAQKPHSLHRTCERFELHTKLTTTGREMYLLRDPFQMLSTSITILFTCTFKIDSPPTLTQIALSSTCTHVLMYTWREIDANKHC